MKNNLKKSQISKKIKLTNRILIKIIRIKVEKIRKIIKRTNVFIIFILDIDEEE